MLEKTPDHSKNTLEWEVELETCDLPPPSDTGEGPPSAVGCWELAF
jgi:hypothetical protein